MDVESIDDIEKRRIEEAERAALLLSDRAIVAQRDLFRLTNEHNGFVPVFFFHHRNLTIHHINTDRCRIRVPKTCTRD